MITKEYATEELDREWKDLILQAQKMGLTLEEVRHFLLVAAKKAISH